MDILDEILSASPQTWKQVPKSSYDDGYYCEKLNPESVEYRVVAKEFEPYCKVKYIKRVQNPFQLALFKISREKAKVDGDYLSEIQGYHVIYEKDLDTALKHTVDYRRYEHSYELCYFQQDYMYGSKQPKFIINIKDAVNAFSNATYGQNKLVLKCDVLSASSSEITTKTQADYNVNYVICIEQN